MKLGCFFLLKDKASFQMRHVNWEGDDTRIEGITNIEFEEALLHRDLAGSSCMLSKQNRRTGCTGMGEPLTRLLGAWPPGTGSPFLPTAASNETLD